MLDLDADSRQIEDQLAQTPLHKILKEGIRIPGVWSAWEAGVRAVLVQQVSIKAAIRHLNHLIDELYESDKNAATVRNFPSPDRLVSSDLSFLKMPQRRKDTLKSLACFVQQNPEASPDEWLEIKGIGPWTVQYAKMRGCSEPDHFLEGDLVVKKMQSRFGNLDITKLSPWGSYATFQCWNAHS
jgi:AraC family transcriptional regulator of adaptative response / DNA-3-methyladenine glycosylase II